MSADLQLYHVSQVWAEAAQLLSRLQAQGGSLGNRDRRTLREAGSLCGIMVVCLTAPGGEHELTTVAARLSEVVQPMVSRPLLVEQLFRAQDALAMLVASQPGLERVAMAPAQMAWLQEFLSECCLALLRDLASSQLRRHPSTLGS